jgi:hypothetical protein
MTNDEHKGRRRANGSPALGANSEIGRKLKQYYDDLVTEEVPDRFTDLLRQLEESESKNGQKDNA